MNLLIYILILFSLNIVTCSFINEMPKNLFNKSISNQYPSLQSSSSFKTNSMSKTSSNAPNIMREELHPSLSHITNENSLYVCYSQCAPTRYCPNGYYQGIACCPANAPCPCCHNYPPITPPPIVCMHMHHFMHISLTILL